MSWQRPVRLIVLALGVASAAAVYFGFRERTPAATPGRVERTDPNATIEVSGGADDRIWQFDGLRRDFTIRYARVLGYPDGTSRLVDVEITAENSEGRTFVVAAPLGRVSRDNVVLELENGVELHDTEGFELSTPRGVFNSNTGAVSADGDVTFSKGGMRGSGHGMSYDQRTDVLTLNSNARIDVDDDAMPMRFTAGTAVLDRLQDRLMLDGGVHADRGGEITNADRATLHLTPAEDVVTFVELRGNARVTGGASFEAMQANDIDMDYTDDGGRLEAAVLIGDASVRLQPGAGGVSREVGGERLDIAMTPDGTLDVVTGDGRVWMSLPGSGAVPARRIRAEELAASGRDGELASAEFRRNVIFEEEAASPQGARRTARSQRLSLEIAGEAVASALFTGDVVFEEGDLRATAADARYAPEAGTLRLTGVDRRGGPVVSDARLRVAATTIDVGLEQSHITAEGRVKTILRPGAPAPGGRGQAAGGERLPGLLAGDEAVNVSAERLEYNSTSGAARYEGDAWLTQGATEIRAGSIAIDRERGDLAAVGKARSVLMFESGRSEGQAHEIRYSDSGRRITYVAAARGDAASEAVPARLRGPQGDLHALRIEVHLAGEARQVERVHAYEEVKAEIDGKSASGDRLVYVADGERYDITGGVARRARLEWRDGSCRHTREGATLTFDRSADTMAVDGQRVQQTRAIAACETDSR